MADWNWSDIISTAKNIGTSGAEVYHAWKGDDSNADGEDTAYLRGQLAAMEAQQKAQLEADTLRIGDASISTSSLMWVIGGTLGLLAIGLGLKN